ncbi:TIGR02679 family protein [Thermoactinospora rubra]|uniref:TIGR02679 family protein n=1 Tax=Thermoactinospora rubra TaxID=1088767 RepID=UPI001F0B1D62|nr:TIGR02679 family protein [Thermoactinospora rubra]
MVSDPARLRRTLGAPGLARVLSRLAARIEHGRDFYAPVVLSDVTDVERRAVAALLGRRDRGAARLTVPPRAVEAALQRAGICDDLHAAVLALTGPVPVRAEERAREERARAELLDVLSGCRHAGEPWFAEWTAGLIADGTLTKAVRQGGEVIRRARAVLDLLPSDARPISVLAEQATGDTKALSGTPLARLVERALAARAGTPVTATAAGRRALWESAGVIVDDLASQVLVLGVRATGSPLAQWLTAAAETATPFRITLHQLATMPLRITSPRVYVCENPAVLRAAVGVGQVALICTEGIPSLACHRLLAACAGRSVWWRGDFDWTGLRTTAEALARYGATPWRMDVATYERALNRGESEPLKGSPAVSPWAPDLAARMAATGRAVMEERLVTELVEDLVKEPGCEGFDEGDEGDEAG